MNTARIIIVRQVAYTTMFDVYSVYTPFMRNVLKHGPNVVEDLQNKLRGELELELVTFCLLLMHHVTIAMYYFLNYIQICASILTNVFNFFIYSHSYIIFRLMHIVLKHGAHVVVDLQNKQTRR